MLDTIATNNVEDPATPVSDPLDLGSTFHQYFEIVPALSNALKDEVYRVRHQVYCEDLKFESARPDRLETDEHDSNSLHLLLRSVKTGEFIGCTRIVRPRPDDSHYHLPFETTCATALDRSIIDPARLPRDRIAEVSRLAVVASYRRRKGEANSPVSLADEDSDIGKSRRFPYIPLGLYLGTTELARISGIDTLFVLTEPDRQLIFASSASNCNSLGKQLSIAASGSLP